jgi:hypothetical protein
MIYAPHAPDAKPVGAADKPVVYYSPSERTWRLAQDFIRQIDGFWWCIPAPFDFDLASIPRILWPLLASHELGVLAPLCHDWLYRHGGVPPWGTISPATRRTYTRAETDKLFLRQMKEDGVGWFRRNAAYAAVRAFGASSWQDAPPLTEPLPEAA